MTKEEKKAYNKAYREENKEKVAYGRKAYREANKEKVAYGRKAWEEANKEKRKAYMKAYREANKEKKKAYDKAYSEANKEKRKAHYKTYRNKRLKSDPVYKFKHKLRLNVIQSFTRGGFTKNSSTVDILGCDWDTFINHITSKFTEGMTLENQGEWHLDHQIPLALAKTEEESAELCYYTNYQPLWAKDNLQKNDKLRIDNISYSNKLRFIKYINRYEEANK